MTAGSGPNANPAALVGTTIGNTFALEKLLGQGRHGTLFEGRHARLGQRYAVRVLGLDANRRAALVGTLSQCAAVVHPNLMPVREIVALGDDKLALCTPLLPGLNLSQRVAAQGKLTVAEGTVMMRQAISALHALHKQGLVHGNLSEGNVFFTQYDDVSVDNVLGSNKGGQVVQLLDPALQVGDAPSGQTPASAADDQQALGKLVLAHVADLAPGQRKALERSQEARAEARYPSVLGLWQAFDAARPGLAGKRGAGSVATALVPQIRLQPKGGGRRNLVIAGIAVGGLILLSLVVFMLTGRSGRDPAAPAVPALAVNDEVHLAFAVTPETARVNLNGSTTLASTGLTLPRSNNAVSLVFSAEGYQEKTVSVVPSGARTVAVALTKVAPPEPAADPKLVADEDDEDGDAHHHKKREHHRRHKSDGTDAKDGSLPALMKIKK